MKDPNLQVISNDIAVVIKDKYPKAKHHYLILPWNNIPSIYHVYLGKLHINLKLLIDTFFLVIKKAR